MLVTNVGSFVKSYICGNNCLATSHFVIVVTIVIIAFTFCIVFVTL